jgi:acyl carrier protein
MHTVNEDAVQSWLSNHLAEQLGLEPQEIDAQKPFTEYGLDSIVGVSLAGDLEEWLGLQLSPTLLWDYPTIAMLAQHLTAEFYASCEPVGVASTASLAALDSAAIDGVDAEQLLANLDAMSDEDVETLLGSLLVTQDA